MAPVPSPEQSDCTTPPFVSSISNLTVPSPHLHEDAATSLALRTSPQDMSLPDLPASLTATAPPRLQTHFQSSSDPRPRPPRPAHPAAHQSTSCTQEELDMFDSHSSLVEASRLEVDFSDLSARIGVGTYGAVHVGRYFGELVAVKRIRMPDASPAQRDDHAIQARRNNAMLQFAREIRRYERISHPGIVRFLGVTLPPDSSALLITELMHGGSLADAVGTLRRARVHFQSACVVRVALQACGGLRALHSAKCTWGDAKPANILLSAPVEADGHFPPCAEARIADFGLSRSVGQSLLADTTLSGTGQPAGTYNYMAPEMFVGEGEEGEDGGEMARAADIYSFGMVIYEMTTLRTPWRGCPMMEVYDAVTRGKRPQWPVVGDEDYDKSVPEELRALVESCWSQDANARPSADAVFDHLDRYSMSVNRSDGVCGERHVTELYSGVFGGDGMRRALSKESDASTAVALCDSGDATLSGDASDESRGLDDCREDAALAADDKQHHAMPRARSLSQRPPSPHYHNARVAATLVPPVAAAPRVSPVTSPEPRSLNARHASAHSLSAFQRSSSSSSAAVLAAHSLMNPASPSAHPPRDEDLPHGRPQAGRNPHDHHHHGDTAQPPERITRDAHVAPSRLSADIVYQKDRPKNLERAMHVNLPEQGIHQPLPPHDDKPALDNFITDRPDDPAWAHLLPDSTHLHHSLHASTVPPSLTQTVAGTFDGATVDLTSSLASSTSARPKRSKRLHSIIERTTLAFLEKHQKEDEYAKLPPRLRKELADKKAAEEVKKQSDIDSLRIIDSAKSTADFSAVLEEMRLQRHSAAVSKEGTIFLSNYCSDKSIYYEICEEGGVEEMVSAASLHGRNDVSLCVTFCKAMTALSEHYDDKVGHLVRGVGAPSLVIELLDQHSTDVPLQTIGCECLAVIASSSELSRSAVATLGGPAVVYRAITKNNTSFKDVDLAKASLKAIRQIAQDNERAAEFLVQVAALDAVSRAADVFTNHKLESHILATLRAFSFYNGGRRNIIMSSGLKALTSIMLRNRDPEFMVLACTFIRAIARWRDLECEEAMLQSCISERIVELMHMSNDIPGEEGARVAWYSSHACTFLASFGSRSKQRLRLVGAIDCALNILSHPRQNARVVHSASDALAELTKGEPESKLYADKCNAVQLLTEAIETYSSIWRVRVALEWTLDQLSSINAPATPAFGSRVYNELMSNMNNTPIGLKSGPTRVTVQAKPRRFLGFNLGRKR